MISLFNSTKIKFLCKQGLVFLFAFCLVSSTFANPVLDNIGAGQVQIQNAPNSTLIINQNSPQAIINWQSFNINQGETTHFEQPANGIALNRVTGNYSPSQIYGTLTATGKIILINPAGIYFGPSAYVSVGGMIASTANISNQDFLNQYYHFSQVTPTPGQIINQGQLIAADHGLIALIGGNISNTGLIQANLGHVVLATGNSFLLTFAGNDLVSFTVNDKSINSSNIQNSGTLRANGGNVLITANAAQGVLDNVINMNGYIEAKSVTQQNGDIILGNVKITGDTDKGVVRVASKVNLSGKKGGNIDITGNNILIDNDAFIDASGDLGGGNIHIGGNLHGSGPLPNAMNVIMAPQATLLANALTNGNGGEIVLWSNGSTQAYGLLSAQGGMLGGNGGLIETSGHYLDVTGIHVSTLANRGQTGTWLLDPFDLTIQDNAGTNVNVNFAAFTYSNNGAGASILDYNNLATQLATNNITVQTTGNITVIHSVTWAAATILSLMPQADININAAITGTNANSGLTLVAGSNSNFINIGSGGTIQVGVLTLSQGILTTLASATDAIGNNTQVILNTGTQFNLNNNETIGSLQGTGSLNLATGITLQNGGNNQSTTYSGTLTGSGTFDKEGTGTLTLNGTSPSFLGNITINNGILNASSNNALGSTTTGTTTVNSGGTLQLSSTAQINKNFIFNGSGYGGTGTLLAGIGGGTITGGSITLGSDVILNTPNFIEIDAPITGNFGITKLGTNGLLLAGNNSYTGLTIINAGTLIAHSDTALGTTAQGTIIANGAAIDINAAHIGNESLSVSGSGVGGSGAIHSTTNGGSLAGNITLTGDTSISGSGNDLLLSGNITGVSNLLAIGTNRLILSGNNSGLSGTVSISGVSTLQAASNNALGVGQVFVNTGGKLELNNVTIPNQYIVLDGNGSGSGSLINLGNNQISNGTLFLNVNSSIGGTGNLTFNGIIDDGGLARTLTKYGTGNLVLNGNNTYSGITDVNQGTLTISQAHGLGLASAAQIDNGASLQLNGTFSLPQNLSISGSGNGGNGVIMVVGGNTVTIPNTVTMLGDSYLYTNIGNDQLFINGSLNGAFNLTKIGLGTLKLSGVNGYTGNTFLNQGTLMLGNNEELPNTSLLNLSIATTFDMNGFNETVGMISGPGAIILSGNLTVGNATSNTYSGSILTGSGNFIKQGTGNLTLSGFNNYSGNTTINQGTLTLGNSDVLPSTNINIAAGATLDINGFSNTFNQLTGLGTLHLGTLLTPGNVILNGGNFAGSITESAGTASTLTKIGAGNLILSGSNAYTGLTSVNGGTLEIDNSASLPGTTTVTGVGSSLLLNNLTTSVPINLVNGGSLVAAGNVTDNGSIAVSGTSNAVNANLGAVLNLNGAINGPGNLSFGGIGQINVFGAIGTTTPLNNLITGSNTLINSSQITTNGTQEYGNPYNLTNTTSITAGNVLFDSTLNASSTNYGLTINTPGSVTFSNPVGNLMPLHNLTINASSINLNGGSLKTIMPLVFNAPIVLGADTTITTQGNGSPLMTYNMLLNNMTGNRNLNIFTGVGNFNFTLGGNVALNNVSINPTAGSNNTFDLNTTNPQNWYITGPNAITLSTPGISALTMNTVSSITGGNGSNTFFLSGGVLAGSINGGNGINTLVAGNNSSYTFHLTGPNSGLTDDVPGGFNHIQNIVGGIGTNTFSLNPGVSWAGTLIGRSTNSNSNFLDYSGLTGPFTVKLTSLYNGTLSNGSGPITTFQSITNLVGNNTTQNSLYAPSIAGKTNKLTITGPNTGYLNDPVAFDSTTYFYGTNGDLLSFTGPFTIVSNNNGTLDILFEGTHMFFTGFGFGANLGDFPSIAGIIQQAGSSSSAISSNPVASWVNTQQAAADNLNQLSNQFGKAYNQALNKVKVTLNCMQAN